MGWGVGRGEDGSSSNFLWPRTGLGYDPLTKRIAVSVYENWGSSGELLQCSAWIRKARKCTGTVINKKTSCAGGISKPRASSFTKSSGKVRLQRQWFSFKVSIETGFGKNSNKILYLNMYTFWFLFREINSLSNSMSLGITHIPQFFWSQIKPFLFTNLIPENSWKNYPKFSIAP